jgi:hypothetical protein
MTQPPNDPASIQNCRARNALRHELDPQLRGHGLEIRELTTALAIGNPANPEKGRIHITYANGDVTHKRTTWDYLGPLHGYEPNDDPDHEPGITPAQIIATLTGHTPPTAT